MRSFNPIILTILATVGQIYINVKSILWQRVIYANEVRLIVAIILCVFLTYYSYDIVKQQLQNMTRIESKQTRDENEKYACNKDQVLHDYNEERDHKMSMKKK